MSRDFPLPSRWFGWPVSHGIFNDMEQPEDNLSEEEVARRRDAILRIMVNTPPQPRVSNRPTQGKRKSTGAGLAPKAADRPQKF